MRFSEKTKQKRFHLKTGLLFTKLIVSFFSSLTILTGGGAAGGSGSSCYCGEISREKSAHNPVSLFSKISQKLQCFLFAISSFV